MILGESISTLHLGFPISLMQRVDLVTHDPYSLGVKEGSLEEETWLIGLRDWGVAGQAGGRPRQGICVL